LEPKVKPKKEIRDIPIANLYKYNETVTQHDEYLKTKHDFYGKAVPPHQWSLIDSKTRIGIEVEVENVRHYNDGDMYCWVLHEDNSLRNNGREFVTTPIVGEQIPAALQHLFTTILPKGYDFSNRTSVHVHMNVRNLTSAQITSIICLYQCFEKLLFRFVGAGRFKNIFCVPLLQTQISNSLLHNLQDGFRNLRWYKYSCINLLSIHSFGTIEFRHMHGTDDINKLVSWINLLLCLRLYAVENQLDSILEEIKQLNTNSQYDSFMNKVFKQCVGLLERTNLQDDMEECVVAVKQSTLNNEFHQSILRSVNVNSSLGAYIYKKYTSKGKAEEIPCTISFDEVEAVPRVAPDDWHINPRELINTGAIAGRQLNQLHMTYENLIRTGILPQNFQVGVAPPREQR